MARPKKVTSEVKEENVEVVETTTAPKVENNDSAIDIQKLISDAVSQTVSQMTKEFEAEKIKLQEEIAKVKEEASKVVVEEKPKTKQKYSIIHPDTLIEIRNNIGGRFIMEEKRGNFPVYRVLSGYGDSVDLSYAELRNYWGNNHNFFESGMLSIVDVRGTENTFEELIQTFRMNDIYSDDFSIRDMEDIVNMEYAEFEKALNKHEKVAYSVLSVAINMYREGRFSDISKVNYFRQKFSMPSLFS